MASALNGDKKRVNALPSGEEAGRFISTLAKSDAVSQSSANTTLKSQKEALQVAKLRLDVETKIARLAQQQSKEHDRAMSKSGTGDVGARIGDLIKTSRVGISSGGGMDVMPLVGKLAGLFGELSTPITAAAGAIVLLEQAAEHAAAEMRAFRSAQLTSGGTQYEVAVGRGIGRLSGLSGEDVARQARSFADRISSDPEAMGYANRYGVSDVSGPNGKIDKMEGLLKWIDKLRAMSDPEAIRAARATGTEDFLPLRDLTRNSYEVMKMASRAGGAAYSPENITREANRDAGKAIRDQITGDLYDNLGRTFRNDVDSIARHLIPGVGALGKESDRQIQQHQQQRQSTNVRDENTEQLKELNSMLRRGMFGGGERAHGAVPEAYLQHHGGPRAIKQMIGLSHALGAFAL